MNPLVEKVLSRLGPKARAQAEADLAKQGHPDFIHLRSSAPAQPAPVATATLLDHDPYDVTGSNHTPAKRKETPPSLPPIPKIVCHNQLDSLTIVVKHKVPSWNAILAFGHWQRAKLKKAIQDDFLSALRASADDSLMRTTSARSTMSIAADTLDSYLKTIQERRTSRLAKKRLEKRKTRGRKS
jgi:hypothetical protein